MLVCPNCQTENRESAKFCDECGFPLVGLDLESEEFLLNMQEEREQGAGEDVGQVKPESDGGIDAPIEQDDEVLKTQELFDLDDFDDFQEQAPESRTAEIGVDLSGLEVPADEYGETLVDPSYEAPEPNWRDGNTMQMAPIGDGEKEKSKDFLASSTKKKKPSKKIIPIAIAVVVVAVAAIALVTFQMGMWGGRTIPDVTGMTEADATSVLEGQGFKVSSKQVKSDDTEGLVLITDPEAGNRASEGSEVNIHIATARTIPANIVGMTQQDAAAALAEEGFKNVKFEKQSSEEPEGKVLSVSPEPGSRAKGTSEVVVKVAAPYTVPDVSSMYLDDAIKALEDAGLGYDVVYIVSDSYADGSMIGTSPAAGTKVAKGEIVYIQIAQARATYLENLARSSLAPGTTINVNGTNFIIDSLNSVHYEGNGTVSYSASARAFTQLAGETVYGTPTTINSVISFTDSNQPIG